MKNDSLLRKFKQREEQKQEFKDSLSYSFDYIEWLEKFTAKFGTFSTDSFLYDSELLSEKDKVNVDHLEELFEEIHDYAEENYIEYHEIPYGIFYSLKHNGIGYSIGVDYGQGCSFYCERLDTPDSDALEYEHIMSSVKLPNTIFLDSKLDKLVELIENLSEEVPLESIEKAAQDTFSRLKLEGNSKTLIKKNNFN